MLQNQFFLFFLFITFLQASDRDYSNTIVYYGNFLPYADCDVETNSKYTGYDWYIIKPVIERVSIQNNASYKIECLYEFNWEDLNKPTLFAGGFYITSIFMSQNTIFTQPTLYSSVAVMARYFPPDWLFFQPITKLTAVLILIIFPLMASVSIWILENESLSLYVLYIEMIVSYFFFNEIHIRTSPSKIVRIIMMLIALVFMTMYTGSLVDVYHNYKTFNVNFFNFINNLHIHQGLIEEGGIVNRKIPSYYVLKFVYLTGILPIHSSYSDLTDIFVYKELFDNGTIKELVFNEKSLRYLADRACDLYVVVSGVQDYLSGDVISFDLQDEKQREWNEAVVFVRNQISDEELIKNYNEDPYANNELSICQNKQKLSINNYVLNDFSQLWIIYASGFGLSILYHGSSVCIKCMKIKNNSFIRYNFFRGKRDKKIISKFKKTLMNMCVLSYIATKLNLKRMQDRLNNKRIYKKALSLKEKIRIAYSKTQLIIGKKKLRQISYFKVFLFRQNFFKKMTVKKKFVSKFYKMRFDKTTIHMILLLFDEFLKKLFIQGFCTFNLNCVKTEETLSSYVILYLNLYKKKAVHIRWNELNHIQNLCTSYIEKLLIPLTLKYAELNSNEKDLIRGKVDKLLAKLLMMQSKLDLLDVISKIIKEINHDFEKFTSKKNAEKFKRSKNIWNIRANKTKFNNVPVKHQKHIYYLLKKLKLSELTITNNLDNIIFDLSEENGQLIYKKYEKSIAAEIHAFETNKNFMKTNQMFKRCQNCCINDNSI